MSEIRKALPDRNAMPYRDCAGAVVFNKEGKVFIGRRNDVSPIDGDVGAWQFPQGGIDEGEDPIDAAIRELYEETSIKSVSILTAAPDWIAYDLPDELLGIGLKGKYRGQRQRWFAFIFDGDDAEIDVLSPGGGAHASEFDIWRWETLEQVPALTVAFKQESYHRLAEIFAGIPAQLTDG
jgi:putative (di)nucleoside polyphosphate hydrolase